jgi:hypothetical protein
VPGGGSGGWLGAWVAAAEVTAACRRFETRQRIEEKGARAVSKPKYIHRLTDKYTWALPRIFVGYRGIYMADSSVKRRIYLAEPRQPGARGIYAADSSVTGYGIYVRRMSWRNRRMYIKVVG